MPVGIEIRLWLTDGTGAGTRSIRETTAGQDITLDVLQVSLNSGQVAASLPNGTFVVQAQVEGAGVEPIHIDPATDTVTLLGDLFPGSPGSNPGSFAEAGSEVFFLARQGSGEFAIYRTDGTPAGTQELSVLPAGGSPRFLAAGAGGVFVIAGGGNEGLYHFTPAGGPATFLASGPSASILLGFLTEKIEFGGGLLLPFDDGIHGREPWFSDGTPTGTVRLADLTAGAGPSSPAFFAVNGGLALFSATADTVGREYYVTDGTPAGTVLLGDLNPGLPGGAVNAAGGTALGAGFVLNVFTQAGSMQPWFTGAAPGTAFPLGSLNTDGSSSNDRFDGVEFGGSLYFSASTVSTGAELYVTDGTPAGTGLAADLAPGPEGSGAGPLATLNGGLLLEGDLQNGIEPLRSDGTALGTFQLANTVPDPVSLSSSPRFPVRYGDRVYLRADTVAGGEELYSLRRGEPDAVVLESEPGSSLGLDPHPFVGVNGRMVYRVRAQGGGFNDWQIRAYDPATGTSTVLLELDDFGFPPVGVIYDGAAHFLAREVGDVRRLWRTDGTAAGTEPLPLNQNFEMSPNDLRVFGGQLWFQATESNQNLRLYRSDGTQAGTFSVLAFPEAPVEFLGETPGWLFCETAGTAPNGEVLSVEPSGFVITVTDAITSFAEVIRLSDAVTVGDRLLFSGEQVGSNSLPPDLYTSGGSLGDTEFFGMFALPDEDNVVTGLVEAGGVAFFWTREAGSNMWTLWRTEGALDSLQPLVQMADIEPEEGVALGSGTEVIYRMSVPGIGESYWLARDGATSLEQVVSYTNLLGGGTFSFDEFSARLAGELLTVADDGESGAEVHALPIAELGGYVAEPFGQVCGSARIGSVGEARLGESFEVTLETGPGEPAGLFTAFEQAYTSFGADCASLLGPSVLLASVITDTTGAASVGFQVPGVPSLIGVPFYNQWAVLRTGGPVFGLLDLSNGLEVVLGS